MRLFPLKLSSYLILGLALILLAVAACSSDDDPEPETPTVAASRVSASATVEFIPTAVIPVHTVISAPTSTTVVVSPTTPKPEPTVVIPTATPSIVLANYLLVDVELGVCRLTGDLHRAGESRQGTAPAPTSIPASETPVRDPEIVEQELRQFAYGVGPVMNSLVDFSEAMQASWPHAETIEQQAGVLQVFGNRLGQLCSAASLLTIPLEILDETSALAESVRISHAWVSLALDGLVCCGSAQSDYYTHGLSLTSNEIRRASAVLVSKLDSYIESPVEPIDRTLGLDTLGFEMEISHDAVVVRNSIDVVISFPTHEEILDPASLGPKSWGYGTGIRIRRIRNSGNLTPEELVGEYGAMIHRYGPGFRVSDITMPMFEEIQFSTLPLENGWVAMIVIFVEDGFAYLVESMCHPNLRGQCDSVKRPIETLRFS